VDWIVNDGEKRVSFECSACVYAKKHIEGGGECWKGFKFQAVLEHFHRSDDCGLDGFSSSAARHWSWLIALLSIIARSFPRTKH
jgi:hypothetical protein